MEGNYALNRTETIDSRAGETTMLMRLMSDEMEKYKELFIHQIYSTGLNDYGVRLIAQFLDTHVNTNTTMRNYPPSMAASEITKIVNKTGKLLTRKLLAEQVKIGIGLGDIEHIVFLVCGAINKVHWRNFDGSIIGDKRAIVQSSRTTEVVSAREEDKGFLNRLKNAMS